MTILAQVTSEVGSLTQFIPLLLLNLLIATYSNIWARMKGRNVAAWTILGFIPMVNVFSSLLLQGSTNLNATKEIEELKKRLHRIESKD